MDHDESIQELEMEQLADLADALELEASELANMLFEVTEECDKLAVMTRVMELEKLLIDVKKYLVMLEL
jgi:hypothetical protein